MADGVTRLKELLLDKEQRALGELTSRVDTVYERAGSREQMRDSVAGVLIDAIRAVESKTDQHVKLAAAVSPVVIETVRREVRASANEMADALHPHMGRMISAYVASAIKDMMAKMNRALGSSLSPKRWAIKVKSKLTGRSEAELLLADVNALRLQELYLIRRGSGDLIAHWEAVGAGEVAGDPIALPADDTSGARLRSNRDAVVSAFLTAINEFAREAFAATDGGLQAIDVQSHRIYMRSSPMYLLAAKCSGLPTPQTERLLDQEFAAAIETHRNFLSTKLNGQQPAELRTLLPDLAGRMQQGLGSDSDAMPAGGPNMAKWLLVVIAAGLISWLLWDKWLTWQTERTRTAVDTVLTGSIMGSYVSGVEVERGGRLVRLKGLAPSQDEKAAVLSAIQRSVGETRIEDRIELLPDRGDGGVQSLKRDVLESSASATLAATQRALQRSRSRIQQVESEIERLARDAREPPVRTGLDAAAKRVTAASSELDGLWKTVTQATVRDDLNPLQPRLEGIHALVRQAAAGLAGLRGEKGGPAMPRIAAGGDRHAGVREEAELISSASDTLWTEVAVTERHLLRQTIAHLERQMANLPAPAQPSRTPRQEFQDWAQGHAVFFSAEANYRDAADSTRVLDSVAAMMKRIDVVVRVVGYTDDLGTTQRNSSISTDRALKVRQALIERGVPSERLVAVGRPNGANVSAYTGLNSPNRRVEFEIGFDQEKGGG